MDDNKPERWQELCSQISNETDAEKLVPLVQELNRILEDKYDRADESPGKKIELTRKD
jgi:hypothetical protein